MAEARSAVTYNVEKTNLLFQITDDEIILRINKDAVPYSLSRIRRSLTRRAYRTRNALVNAFYPAPPIEWAFLVAAPAALMLTFPTKGLAQEDRNILISLLSTIASSLWGLERFLPSFLTSALDQSNANLASAALISTTLGTGFILTLSYVRRILLRALLSYQGWLYDEPKKQSIQTTIWALLVKFVSGQHSFKLIHQQPLLYSSQHALPKLPVPSLDQTCQKYLQTVKPLLSEEQYTRMVELVNSFKHNEGKKLQLYLILKSWVSDNYVADWWEKYVYLRGRSPIVINSNYYILDSGLPVAPTTVQVARAANCIATILEFKYSLDHELIPPMNIRGTVPMCMAQYERMFSTTRIPGKEIDTLQHDDYDSVTHIVVLRKGNYYALEVYDQNGVPYSAAELEVQLKWIVNDAEKQQPTKFEASIPALTTENRTTWANAREEFFSLGINKVSLDKIEKALFVLSLDHVDQGSDWIKMGRSLFHGDGTNRWCDKSFNVVVFPNGKLGLHVEHSWADAPVISHMWEYAVIMGHNNHLFDQNGLNKRKGPISARPPPNRLRWDLTQKAEKVIETAVVNINNLIADVDHEILTYNTYGKGFIKKCNVSPDAYVQMAMQIAYKRDAGVFGLTYESSMTRLFRHGRTETVRPVSMDSKAFVEAFENPEISKKEKIDLLRKAGETHQNYYRDCMAGKGIDRHLFALYVVSQGMGLESQFLKNALGMEWKLSTSQQPQGQTGFWNPSRSKEEAAKISPGGGFGPVSDDGYGVSYMIAGEEKLFFHISSKKSSKVTDSARFGQNIFKALDEMKELFK